MDDISYRIHGTGIFTHILHETHKNMTKNVGKYTVRPMDPMGYKSCFLSVKGNCLHRQELGRLVPCRRGPGGRGRTSLDLKYSQP